MRQLWFLVLVLLGGCRPAVDLFEYDPRAEQLVFLYRPNALTQVYFRDPGYVTSWTPTAASTAERPPPDRGPWELVDDWVVVFAKDSQLQAARVESKCSAYPSALKLRAPQFHIEACAPEETGCCTVDGALIVGEGGKCRTLSGWTDEKNLCVVNNP